MNAREARRIAANRLPEPELPAPRRVMRVRESSSLLTFTMFSFRFFQRVERRFSKTRDLRFA